MNTSEVQNREAVKQAFQNEIDCAQMLMQSLDREYAALAEHHTATLEEVVSEKKEIIQQLELISINRENLLTSFKSGTITSSEATNPNYHFNSDEQLTSLWNRLVDIAEACRDKNRINGSIVELVSKQSRHALDILHGIVPHSSTNAELYNNAGHTIKSADKRSLVQV